MPRVLSRIALYAVLGILLAIWIFPLATSLLTIAKTPEWFGASFFWDVPPLTEAVAGITANVRDAFARSDIAPNILNSVLFAVVAGIGSGIIASSAAFALTQLDMRHPDRWFVALFMGNLFPFQMFLIPLYLFLTNLGLYDTRLGLSLVYIGICVPFALFVYRNYALTIPKDLFDSARIDGASDLTMFLRVFLPISRPALAVVFIFQFIWTWNDLLFGLVLAESTRPVMTALSKLTGLRAGTPPTVVLSGALISAVPAVIILFSLQRYFVRGFTISLEK